MRRWKMGIIPQSCSNRLDDDDLTSHLGCRGNLSISNPYGAQYKANKGTGIGDREPELRTRNARYTPHHPRNSRQSMASLSQKNEQRQEGSTAWKVVR